MNFSPEVWGPHFWYTLHTISFSYPEHPTSTDMRRYREFYELFAHLLPCDSCRLHYKSMMSQYPIDGHLNDRDSLSRWVVFLHNQVNKRLGRKYMPYEDVVELYRRWFNQNEIRSKTMNFALLCGILMIAYFVYKRYTK